MMCARYNHSGYGISSEKKFTKLITVGNRDRPIYGPLQDYRHLPKVLPNRRHPENRFQRKFWIGIVLEIYPVAPFGSKKRRPTQNRKSKLGF